MASKKDVLKFLPYIFHSIYFNFRYLPIKQAYKLPILLFRPHLKTMKGTITIKDSKIKCGLIQLGKYRVSLFPNAGIVWENSGGNVIFNGSCNIGNDSALSINQNASLNFGRNFNATCGLKIACYYSVSFENDVLIGWNNTFLDTDFHKVKATDGSNNKSYGAILIRNNSWVGNGCFFFKNAQIPCKSIVGAASLINKTFENIPHCLIAGNPAKVIKSGFFWDKDDDKIDYEF